MVPVTAASAVRDGGRRPTGAVEFRTAWPAVQAAVDLFARVTRALTSAAFRLDRRDGSCKLAGRTHTDDRIVSVANVKSAGSRHGRGSRFLLAAVLVASSSSSRAASDQDMGAALASMAREISDVRQSCDEPVQVAATKVALSDKVAGVHVILTSRICLGAFGQYDYLLVRDSDGRWQRILGSGPGLLTFAKPKGSRFARIGILALMNCELAFAWNGSVYVQHASPACGGGSKGGEWQILERIMRASEGSAAAEDRSPTALLREMVAMVDRGEMPSWVDPRFPLAMQPYLTSDLIAAVLYGKRTAQEKSIDLYDGDFLTGAQGVLRARLFRADVTGMDADRAVVTAVIGTTGGEVPTKGGTCTYIFRRIGGGWKLDDFRTDPNFRNVKDIFLHPENPAR